MTNPTAKYIAAAFLGAVVSGVAVFVVANGGAVDVSVSPKGEFKFKTSQGQSLTELISDGIDAVSPVAGDSPEVAAEKENARGQLNAILANRGYYSFEDDALVDAIRRLDKNDPASFRIRNILYDLAGPFDRPMTFRGADRRLWGAIEDLHSGLHEDPADDSVFFAELYSRMLDENSILGAFNNQIRAKVKLVPGNGDEPRLYACAGSDLRHGTFVTAIAGVEGGASINGEILQDPQTHNCSTKTNFFRVLSGESVLIGANRAAFDLLFPPDLDGIDELDTARAAREGPARLVVYPKHLAPRILLSQN